MFSFLSAKCLSSLLSLFFFFITPSLCYLRCSMSGYCWYLLLGIISHYSRMITGVFETACGPTWSCLKMCMGDGWGQWFSKWGFLTSSISISWGIVYQKSELLGPLLKITVSRGGVSSVCFYKPFRWSLYGLKCENQTGLDFCLSSLVTTSDRYSRLIFHSILPKDFTEMALEVRFFKSW